MGFTDVIYDVFEEEIKNDKFIEGKCIIRLKYEDDLHIDSSKNDYCIELNNHVISITKFKLDEDVAYEQHHIPINNISSIIDRR